MGKFLKNGASMKKGAFLKEGDLLGFDKSDDEDDKGDDEDDKGYMEGLL